VSWCGPGKVSFKQLMALKEAGEDEFESLTPAWGFAVSKDSPPRAFGGYVYAQSVFAASKTVPKGMTIHVRPQVAALNAFVLTNSPRL